MAIDERKKSLLYILAVTFLVGTVLGKSLDVKQKCTKFDFGWGSAPDPSEGTVLLLLLTGLQKNLRLHLNGLFPEYFGCLGSHWFSSIICSRREHLIIIVTGLNEAGVVQCSKPTVCMYAMFIKCDRHTSNNKHKKQSQNDVLYKAAKPKTISHDKAI